MGLFSEVIRDIQQRRERALEDIENTIPYIQMLIDNMKETQPEWSSDELEEQGCEEI
jgi:hypothetical protein